MANLWKKDDREYFKVLKDCFDDFNYLSFELNNFAGSDRILNKFKLFHKKYNKQKKLDATVRNQEKFVIIMF